MNTINVAVIGCGKIAQVRHIPEYLANPNTKLAGYYDLNHQRAQDLADQYGGKAFKTVEDLLADPTIDAVSVCTSNSTHAANAIAAMKAGKDVLCEKPMATSLDECIAMADTARETGRKLMIDQNQRFTAAHQKAKELAASGFLGKIISFSTTFGHGGPETWSIEPGKSTWFFDKNKSVLGAMADLGVHKTDLIQYILGRRIIAVTARIATLDKKDPEGHPIGVDDNAFCIYEMEGGIIGTMRASWTYYGEEDNSTLLYGTKGILHIYDSPDYSMKACMRDGSTIIFQMDHIQTNDNQTSTGIIDGFIDSLVKDERPPIDAEDVLPAMRAVFAAMESQKTGKRIVIKERR